MGEETLNLSTNVCLLIGPLVGRSDQELYEQVQTGTYMGRQGQTGTDKDRQGQKGSRRDRQEQIGTYRDYQRQKGTVYVSLEKKQS